MDELLWLDSLGQIVGVDLNQDIVVPELGERRIGIGITHVSAPLNQGSAIGALGYVS